MAEATAIQGEDIIIKNKTAAHETFEKVNNLAPDRQYVFFLVNDGKSIEGLMNIKAGMLKEVIIALFRQDPKFFLKSVQEDMMAYMAIALRERGSEAVH